MILEAKIFSLYLFIKILSPCGNKFLPFCPYPKVLEMDHLVARAKQIKIKEKRKKAASHSVGIRAAFQLLSLML